MQVKTTKGYIYTPIKMAKIIKSDHNKYWRGCGGTGALTLSWWECQMETLGNGSAVF